ncbi:dTDP-glucose 4,6-dehydratase [Dehalococcoidia bacterium]|nr:dTDP-glucose 4,6-dehydratase [Dehalococcoidia bacterium]
MKILVTGGAGFIGSNFVCYLLREHPDWEVTNLDKLTYAGNLENLGDVEGNPRYHFVKGDITDRELVDKLLGQGFDVVVNFAAESHVDRSILDSSPFIRTNVQGTQVLLEGARQHKVKLFLQVSTDEVYGSLGAPGKFTEESPLLPNSPYAASKAAADCLCRAYYHTYGLPVVITRCSNNYGPFQFPEKLIPLVITNALEGKEIPVYGDGLNVRDWVHVRDHCRALDLIIQQGKPGEIYNIGGNCEETNLQLVHCILAIMAKPRSLITFVADRPGHDRRYALETSKIERELGWRPAILLGEGLRGTVQWYIQNESWWRRVKSGEYVEYYERMYSQRAGSG